MKERTISRPDGIITFWSLAEFTHQKKLEAALSSIGAGKFAPLPRTPLNCLKDAMEVVLKDHILQPTKERNGYVAIRRQCADDAVGGTYGRIDYVARIDGTSIACTPYDTRADDICDQFNDHCELVTAGQVGLALVKICEYLQGVRLRPNGGIYWLPGDADTPWQQVGQAISQCATGNGSAIHSVRHHFDQDAVHAIAAAIIENAQRELAEINRDLASGDLGEKAIETRRQQVEALSCRLGQYDTALSTDLAVLHQAIVDTTLACGKAALLTIIPREEAVA